MTNTNTQETKTVGYREYTLELRKLQRKYMDNHSYITISNMDYIHEDDPIHLGISWASYGEVEIEEAKEFAAFLHEAIVDCENFKYNGYIIDYSELENNIRSR